jgi:hypothetical protein
MEDTIQRPKEGARAPTLVAGGRRSSGWSGCEAGEQNELIREEARYFAEWIRIAGFTCGPEASSDLAAIGLDKIGRLRHMESELTTNSNLYSK